MMFPDSRKTLGYAEQLLPNQYGGAEASVVVNRAPSTALLGVDSEDRFKGVDILPAVSDFRYSLQAPPTSFTVNRNGPFVNGYPSRIALTEFNMPWTIPNVNKKTNKILVQWENGGGTNESVLELAIGFYTPALLASAMQVLIQNIDPLFATATFTYGTGINGAGSPVFRYSTGDPNVFMNFIPMSRDMDTTSPSYYPYATNTKQLFDLLGFTEGANLTGNGLGNNALSNDGQGGYTFCQYTKFVDIVCTQLTDNMANKDATTQPVSRDVLARIYLASNDMPTNVLTSSGDFCPIGCVPFQLYKDFSTPKQLAWNKSQQVGGYLKFDLYDDSGDLLSDVEINGTGVQLDGSTGTYVINNRTDWSMTLLVSEN